MTKPAWRWARVLAAAKRSNSRASPFGRGVAARGAPARPLLVVVEEQRRRVEVALGDPVAAQLLLDQLAEGVHADAVDQHLDAGAGAVGAQLVLAVEDPQHRLGHLQVLAVVGADELVERRARRAA